MLTKWDETVVKRKAKSAAPSIPPWRIRSSRTAWSVVLRDFHKLGQRGDAAASQVTMPEPTRRVLGLAGGLPVFTAPKAAAGCVLAVSLGFSASAEGSAEGGLGGTNPPCCE